jgi:hypothetical protein
MQVHAAVANTKDEFSHITAGLTKIAEVNSGRAVREATRAKDLARGLLKENSSFSTRSVVDAIALATLNDPTSQKLLANAGYAQATLHNLLISASGEARDVLRTSRDIQALLPEMGLTTESEIRDASSEFTKMMLAAHEQLGQLEKVAKQAGDLLDGDYQALFDSLVPHATRKPPPDPRTVDLEARLKASIEKRSIEVSGEAAIYIGSEVLRALNLTLPEVDRFTRVAGIVMNTASLYATGPIGVVGAINLLGQAKSAVGGNSAGETSALASILNRLLQALGVIAERLQRIEEQQFHILAAVEDLSKKVENYQQAVVTAVTTASNGILSTAESLVWYHRVNDRNAIRQELRTVVTDDLSETRALKLIEDTRLFAKNTTLYLAKEDYTTNAAEQILLGNDKAFNGFLRVSAFASIGAHHVSIDIPQAPKDPLSENDTIQPPNPVVWQEAVDTVCQVAVHRFASGGWTRALQAALKVASQELRYYGTHIDQVFNVIGRKEWGMKMEADGWRSFEESAGRRWLLGFIDDAWEDTIATFGVFQRTEYKGVRTSIRTITGFAKSSYQYIYPSSEIWGLAIRPLAALNHRPLLEITIQDTGYSYYPNGDYGADLVHVAFANMAIRPNYNEQGWTTAFPANTQFRHLHPDTWRMGDPGYAIVAYQPGTATALNAENLLQFILSSLLRLQWDEFKTRLSRFNVDLQTLDLARRASFVAFIRSRMFANLSLATSLWKCGGYPHTEEPYAFGHAGDRRMNFVAEFNEVLRLMNDSSAAIGSLDGGTTIGPVFTPGPNDDPQTYATENPLQVFKNRLAQNLRGDIFEKAFPSETLDSIPPIKIGMTKLSVLDSLLE